MENNQILSQFLEVLIPALATFIVGVFTYFGAKLKAKYEEKVNNETAKTVVNDAVRFVEQVYKDLKGPEKLQKATEQVAEILNGKGIKITTAEINMLIESAVYGLKEGWFKSEQPTVEETIVEELPAAEEVVVKESEATE